LILALLSLSIVVALPGLADARGFGGGGFGGGFHGGGFGGGGFRGGFAGGGFRGGFGRGFRGGRFAPRGIFQSRGRGYFILFARYFDVEAGAYLVNLRTGCFATIFMSRTLKKSPPSRRMC
jgi:hypothetical protein